MEYIVRNYKRVVASVFLATFLVAPASTLAGEKQAAVSNAGSSATLDFANGLYARKMYGPAIAEYEKFLKQHPNSPEVSSARFRYADSFYYTRDYASAIAHFEIFLRNFPLDKRVPMALFRLGTARFYQGNPAQAIRTFLKLRTSDDPVIRSGARFYIAKCLDKKGKSARSLHMLEQLVSENTQSEYATYAGIEIGDHYIKEGNFAEALKGYKIAADNPQPQDLSSQAKYKVAEIYFSQKDYVQAALYYQKVFEDFITNMKDKALLGLFYCDFQTQNLESAEKRYAAEKAVIDAGRHKSEILFLMANLLADKDRKDEAILKLDEVLTDPLADDLLKEKAQFKKAGILASRGENDKSLLELDKLTAASKNKPRAIFEKAQVLGDAGKLNEALQSYEQVITQFPDSEQAKMALFQSAITCQKLGQNDSARRRFEQYAEKYSAEPNVDVALLQVIQIDLDTQQFQSAHREALQFIQSRQGSPKLDIAYYKKAVAATGLKQVEDAAGGFQVIVQQYPNSKLYAEALYGLAVSYENTSKPMEALAVYEDFMNRFSEHALSRAVLPRIGYLYIQTEQLEKMSAFYQELIFNKTQVKIDTDGAFWLVQYLLDKKDYDTLNRVLDVLPARFTDKDLDHEMAFFKGEAAMGNKDYSQAATHYSTAITTNTNGSFVPHAYLGLGIAQAAMSQDTEAEKNFNEALKFDSEIKVAMRARFEIANLRLKAQDLENAAKSFMMVAILYDDPKYTPPSLYKAGECYRALGRLDDAVNAFTELKNKYPDSEWTAKI